MTEPSQYFKGRTVQEQMNEVIGYVDTRAAEVATTAIASDVAQVHQDMLDADADASAAAASAAAAAGTLANAVKKTGEASQSIAGDIAVSGNLSGGVVTGTTVTVPTPVNNTDAANKKYVDDQDALKVSITNINSYAVGLTGNQDKTGYLRFMTGYLGSYYPVCDKTPENVGGKYLSLFKLAKQSSFITLVAKTPAEYLNIFIDFRISSATIKTDHHGTDRFSNTDVIVMGDTDNYYVFIKYPQNRKLIIDLINYVPIFSIGTENLSNIDFSFFSRTLIDEPEIGNTYNTKFVSETM